MKLIVDKDVALLGGDSRTATFSEDRVYRYALTREWGSAWPRAVFIMLNPSTADAMQLDPTCRRCVAFAAGWGCSGLLVLNLFALRSTDPRALLEHPDPVGPGNDLIIRRELAGNVGPVVCAWGVHGTLHGRDKQVVDILRDAGVSPKCLGTTKDGHPRHPLYVPQRTALVDYEAV